MYTYGVLNYERAYGTVASWDGEIGMLQCEKFKDQIFFREKEILYHCGGYHVPVDGVSKTPKIGDVYESTVIEDINQGLIALGNIQTGKNIGTEFERKNSNVWKEPRFPRFIGVVKHWNFESCFGFIESDLIEKQIFFQKKEYLIPYEFTSDPFKAVSTAPVSGDIVTFDLIETPRGLRALGIKDHIKKGG